MVSLFYIV